MSVQAESGLLSRLPESREVLGDTIQFQINKACCVKTDLQEPNDILFNTMKGSQAVGDTYTYVLDVTITMIQELLKCKCKQPYTSNNILISTLEYFLGFHGSFIVYVTLAARAGDSCLLLFCQSFQALSHLLECCLSTVFMFLLISCTINP